MNAVVEALEGRTLLSAAVVPWAVVRNGHPSTHFGGSAVSAAADASLPAAPTGVDLAAVSDTGVSPSDDVTRFNNATPGASLQFVVSGTLSGATVTVYADGTAIGTGVASGPTTAVTTNGTSALANGVRTIAATQTTSDGESPASPALPVTIDTIGPAASSNPPAVYGGGATAYLFGVTYDDAVGVDGGSFDSSDVRVTGPNGFSQLASFVAAAAPSGGTRSATYRITPPGGSWDAADNGTYTVAVAAGQVRDTAGNFVAAGAVGTATVAIAGQPSQPDLADAADSGGSPTDDITSFNNASAPTAPQFVVGNTLPGAVVTVLADGVAVGSAVATGPSTTVTLNGTTKLADGIRTITARQTGLDGRDTASSGPLFVTIDTVAPATPPAPDLEATSDTGLSNTDNLTNSRNLVFDATGSPYFRAYRDGALVGPAYASGTSFAAGTPEGTHGFTVSAVDAAGNESPQSPALAVTSDFTIPTITAALHDVVDAGGGSYTFTVTYTDANGIDAATIPNGSIQVTGPNGYLDFPTLVSVDVPGNGSPRVATYRSTPPGGYWDSPDAGTYSVSLANRTVKDVAGNTLPATGLGAFSVSAAGLGAPDLLPASDSGASSADDITNFNNASPATALQFVIANTTPGAFVSLYTDGGIFVGAAMADGTSATITTNPGPAFTDGVHDFWAREQPQGGGPSPDGPSLPVVIDTVATAPGAPTLAPGSDSGIPGDGLTNQGAPTLSIPVSEAGTVHLLVDAEPEVTGPAPAGAATANVPFAPPSVFLPLRSTAVPTSSFPQLADGDFNGDGREDLLVASRVGSGNPSRVTVLLGRADGTFGTAATLSLATFPSNMRSGDLNGDGRADVVVADSFAGLLVYLGNGDGTFAAPTTFSDNANGVAIADVNRDGRPDLLSTTTTVLVRLGNGDGTFQPPRTATTGQSPFGPPRVADVNADGKPDLLIDASGGHNELLGNGDGTFRPPTVVGAGSSGDLETLADVDGDGNVDMVVRGSFGTANSGLGVLWGTGGGAFQTTPTAVPVPAPVPGGAAAVGDFNRDGLLDFAAPSNAQNVVFIAYGAGGRGFTSGTPAADLSQPIGLVAGDVNGDGRIDLVGSGTSANLVATILGYGGRLPDGSHSASATLEDVAGNRSPPGPAGSFTVDTRPPTAALAAPNVSTAGATAYTFTVTYADANGVDGTSPGNGNLQVTGPNGYSQAATLVSVNPPGNGSPRTATYRVTPPGGSWDFGDFGDYVVTLKPGQVKDLAANGAPPAALGWFRVGIPAVLARPDLTNATDSGVSPVDDITNFDNATPARAPAFVLTQTLPGATVTVYADGVAIGLAVATGTTTTVTGDGVTRLPPGAHQITARQTGADGQLSAPSPALTVTVLTDTPAAPPVPVLAPGEDTGEFSNDRLTNSTNPGLQVSAAPAPYYRVYIGGTLVGASYNTNTVFRPGVLPNGSYQFTATAVDAAGNESAQSPPLTVTIDAAPPTASLSAPNVTAPGGQSYTFSVTYRDLNAVARNTLNDEDVTVTAPGGASLAATLVSVDAAGDGSPRTATYRITPPGGYWDEPDNGTYQVVLAANQVQDVAGNWMPAGTLGLFTVAANGVGTPDLLPESDTGASASDNTTKLNNSTAAKALKFSVINTHPGDLVSVFADGVLIGTATASGVVTTVTTDGATALDDGAHAITARLTPSGGAIGPDSPTLSVTVDTTVAPVAAPVLDPASDSGVSNADRLTNVANAAFHVSAPEAGTLHLRADGSGPALDVPAAGQYVPSFSSDLATIRSDTRSYPTGPVYANAPYYVTVVDLNNDGKPDLLVRNNGNTFTAWLGGGDGSFTPVFTGTTPFGRLVTADLNGDGNIDFLTGNAGAATASIWYGNGDGTFRQAAPITYNTTPPTYIQGIGVGDMNGDGTTDVVLATTEGGGAPGLRVLLNKGDGTFLPDRVTIISGVAGAPHQVLITDFDGDGKLDVADSQNQDNGGTGGTAVLVYVGNGDGTFNFRSTTNPLGELRTQVLVSGDFDGNGTTDLARLASGGGPPTSVTVLLNTGDGNFNRPPAVVELPAGQPWGLGAGDFDRDGKTDLVTGYTTVVGGHYQDSYLELMRGRSDGTYPAPQLIPAPGVANDLALADVDQDGRLDVTMAATATPISPSALNIVFGAAGPLPEGRHDVTAWFEDLAGNMTADSPATSVRVDVTPPAAELSPGAPTSGSAAYDFTVTYTDAGGVDPATVGDGDVTVTGRDGYSQAASLVSKAANADGSLTAVYRVPAPGGTWDAADNGTYTVFLQPDAVKDLAGNAAPSATLGTFTVAVGDAPSSVDLAPASDSGVSDSDNLTRFNNGAPADALQFQVGGTFTGATVTIYADGTPIGSAVASGATTVVTTDGATRLPDGTINITARQTLPGQGESPDTEPLPVTIDATAPAPPAPLDLEPASDSGISNTDNVTNVKTPVFDVTAGPYFRVYRGAGRLGGDYQTGATYQPGALADGSDPFTVTAVDAAGNESAPSAALNVTVDTAGPTITSYAAPDVVAAGGTVYQFTTTYADDTAIDVSTLAADRIRVSDLAAFNAFANFYSVDVNSTGTPRVVTYQLTPPGGSWDSSDNRRYSLIATGSVVRDTAGNPLSAAPSGSFDVGILGTPALKGASDSGRSSSDRITNFNNASPAKALSFTVPGTVPGATVTLYADGVPVGSAVASGTLTTVTTDGTTSLADGVHSITARQTPQGGPASGDSPAVSITIDTVAPGAPAAPDLEAASDSGISSTDDLTNVRTPTVDVVASEPGVLHLVIDGAETGATAVAGAAGLFPVPASAGPSSFVAQTSYGVLTQYAVQIATDDFNEDGKLDLVADSVGNGFSIVFGNGDGTFQPGISVPAPYTDTGLIAADLNGDGHTDLVEPRQLSNISVFLGNGDGTFQSPGVYATGVQPGRPVLLDANGDGKWDVAVACTGQGPDFPVLLFLGNGDGTLQPARTIATGGTWFPMATGDLNADGKADLIYGSGGAGYNVILGNGDGTFANPTSYRVGATIRQIVVADANGDGKLDVFTPDLNDGTISLLLGNGDGTLQARQTIPSASPFGLVAADLNRDGKLDLAVTNGDPTYTVSVLWGNGNGTFQAAQSYTDDRFPVGLVAADFDGDGRLDLATANSFGTNVTVLRGTGGPLVDGAHVVTAWAEDVAGNKSATSAPLNVTVDSVAPAVTAAEFVDQPGGQGLRFTFSESVAGTLDATDLAVRRLPNGPDLVIASVSYDDAANAATFYFADPVPDGDYSATLLAGSSGMPAVSDAAGNPLAGGGSGGDYVYQFTRLAGLSAGPGSSYALTGPPDNKLLSVSAGTVTLNEDLSSVYPGISLDVSGGTVVFAVDQHFQNVSLSGNGSISS